MPQNLRLDRKQQRKMAESQKTFKRGFRVSIHIYFVPMVCATCIHMLNLVNEGFKFFFNKFDKINKEQEKRVTKLIRI